MVINTVYPSRGCGPIGERHTQDSRVTDIGIELCKTEFCGRFEPGLEVRGLIVFLFFQDGKDIFF